MRFIIDFIIKYKFWLMFALFEFISFYALIKYNNYQGSVYFTTANNVVGTWYGFTSGVASFFDMKNENTRLERENQNLRKQYNELKNALDEEDELQQLLKKHQRDNRDFDFIGAHVVNATIHRDKNIFTIDRGENDGVKEEAGVVCSAGVVGVVYKTSSNYAVIVPLINEKSIVSCRIDSTEYFGTLQWQQGNPNISYMKNIPRYAEVKEGMLVETNGFSDIFPADIPIGRVVGIEDSDDGLSYTLKVKLNTNFANIRNVSVLKGYSRPERIQLEQKADSLLSDL